MAVPAPPLLAAPSARTGAGADARADERGSTRDRILVAAEAGFAERGFAGTSLRDVATAVGIRIPSLYNHFPSKAELYKAVLTSAIGSIADVLERVDAGEISREPRDVMAAMMEVFRARPNVPKLIQYELLSGGEQLALVLDESVWPTLARGAAALEQASAGSPWKPEQRPLLLLAFYNLLIGHFTTAPLLKILTGDEPDEPRSIERQVEFFGELVKLLVGPEQSDPRSADD
jgi:AcrR family transcriptional regulator